MYKVKVENLKQLEIVLAFNEVSEIVLSLDSFSDADLPMLVDKIKREKKIAWIMLERISRYEENMKSIEESRYERFDLRQSTDQIFSIKNLDGIIIQNLDSFTYMLRRIKKAANDKLMVELNYTMNCYNSETKKVFMDLYNEKRDNGTEVPLLFTAPVELNIYELSAVGYDTMVVYGYIDTMVSANCLRKNTAITDMKHAHANSKDGRAQVGDSICKYKYNFNKVHDYSAYIIDRKGKKLYYKTYCKYCYNRIFNTEPLFLLDKVNEIGIDTAKTFRIDFSFENRQEITNIIKGRCPSSFTRGHIRNSIK